MMWCEWCKEAVEPELEYKHIQGDEYVHIAICPYCGNRLYDEARACPLCGEDRSEHDVACPSCKENVVRVMQIAIEYIGIGSDRLTALDVIYDMWDGITERARIEDRKDEEKKKIQRKDAERMFNFRYKLREGI